MAEHTLEARKVSLEEFMRDYAHKRYEYDDGYAIPMGPEIELENGEIIVAPTLLGHGMVVGRIAVILGGYVLQNDLGETLGAETGFVMQQSPFKMRAADVAFVAKERLNQVKRGAWLPFPPDLAVEVVSEHDRASDIRKKARLYMENGTRLLWIVYPDTREVEVHQPDQAMRLLSEADTLDGGDVLTGFTLALKTLFAPLDSLED